MTDDQINAAIAEACGWVPDCDRGICWDQYGNAIITPPNYCADLNAMHEAEKLVTSDCNLTYANQLARIVDAHYSDDPVFFCATARQRAEAFLRTLSKWEETQK
jgi:hypothetical protein